MDWDDQQRSNLLYTYLTERVPLRVYYRDSVILLSLTLPGTNTRRVSLHTRPTDGTEGEGDV